jgi:hypothetical protein
MRRLIVVGALAGTAVWTALALATPSQGQSSTILSVGALQADSGNVSPRVAVQPTVVRLHQQATIAISDLHAPSVQVRLAGSTYSDGTPLPWRSLHLLGGVWRGSLPTPALPGVYPVVLRTRVGAAPIRPLSFLRVFAPGTRASPSFHDPIEVARWWVRTVPHARLAALKRWPRPAFDRRDVRLHRLYVVAYSPSGHPRVRDQLGMFVTGFRDGYHAPWRLLEVTVEP